MSEEFLKGINELKNKLIDTSRRNKLINYTKPSKSRNLRIIDESPDFIFDFLVKKENKFHFDSIPEPEFDSTEIGELKKERVSCQNQLLSKGLVDHIKRQEIAQRVEELNSKINDLQQKALLTPEERAMELGFNISSELPEVDLANQAIDGKYTNNRLQTLHYPNELEKILKNIERNARSIIEETGSNMLFLVLGFLKWQEANHSERENKSPLVVIPVVLTKTKKANRYHFTLEYSGEGLETNKSLAEKLLFEFGIALPDLTEEMCFGNYIEMVDAVIRHKPRWSVCREIGLDFLHFGKILMYQDLNEENWSENLINNAVLHDIFIGKEISSDSKFAPEYDIDANLVASKTPLVMDADSSQHSAIIDVVEGKNVIIEGPPGTGKSQTISNVIAALIAQKKSVLFVSEKLAALEVVHKRLKQVGLADFCLEIHSNKSKKTKILESIQKRLHSSFGDIDTLDKTLHEIKNKKDKLQEYIDVLHLKFGNIEYPIHRLLWAVEKYNIGANYLKFDVLNANKYTAYELNEALDKLESFVKFHQNYDFHTFFWKGLDLYYLNFIDIDDFLILLSNIKKDYVELKNLMGNIPLKFANELKTVEEISFFINNLGVQKDVEYALLTSVKKNPDTFKEYVKEINELRRHSAKIDVVLKHYADRISHNTHLIENLSFIINSLDEFYASTGLTKNFQIFYLKSLLSATGILSEIGETHYLKLSREFGSLEFEDLLQKTKRELEALEHLRRRAEKHLKLSDVEKLGYKKFKEIEKVIESKKHSLLNFLSGEYRRAMNLFKSCLKHELPAEKANWTQMIVDLKAYLEKKEEINRGLANSPFTHLYDGETIDISLVENLHHWAKKLRASVQNSMLLDFIFIPSSKKYSVFIAYFEWADKYFADLFCLLGSFEKTHGRIHLLNIAPNVENMDIRNLLAKLSSVNINLETALQHVSKEFDFSPGGVFEEVALGKLGTVSCDGFMHNIEKLSVDSVELFEAMQQLFEKYNSIKNIFEHINQQCGIPLAINANDSKKVQSAFEVLQVIKKTSIPLPLKEFLFTDLGNIKLFEKISLAHDSLENNFEKLQKYGKVSHSFCGRNVSTFDESIKKLSEANNNVGILSAWIDFRKVAFSLSSIGLGDIVDAVESRKLPLEFAGRTFLYNFYNTLVKEAFKHYPVLMNFSRLSHEQTIQAYKKLDEELILQYRKKVSFLASQRSIPQGYRSNKKSELTELSLLENELNKKVRHIPIRQLVRRAPRALVSLKPCFMMSPLSVAQYLPQDNIVFDVLLIDEASQLRPEEAMGAIARSRQIVVVGDPKQLPPTSFFDSMEKVNDDETVASESESILDICLSLYKPIRQLRWHYRSQHESLIDFSNQQFYDGNLLVFPSPVGSPGSELGIKYHFMKDATYQNRRNKVEAKMIVEHLENQMKNYPSRSIGIGTFNSDQRDLIQDLIDEREKNSPIMSNYISEWEKTSEPFFVKNLENLQGDERDVILISTTYGKDKESDKVYQRFGPINSDAGWRRLNVMITRSKQKMEVFTSMKSSDIIITEKSSRGVIALKSFLSFLETSLLSKQPILSGKGFDSEFEESVFGVLNNIGYKSVSQVGVAGYFIDLAVISEENSSDFVLAIECDGATYHSSRSARDRDRLKQEVLERLGWTVYRIWSVDWYKNREHEVKKLIEAVVKAQAKYTKHNKELLVCQKDCLKEEAIGKSKLDSIDLGFAETVNDLEQGRSANKSQKYFPDSELRDMLLNLRSKKIAREFEIDKRCILSDMMIELFVKHKPLDMDDFRNSIPLRYRNDNVINIDQMKFMPDIFEILELAGE